MAGYKLVGVGGSVKLSNSTITTAPIRGSLTDYSGTITTGGSSQSIISANTNRSYLFIENVSSDLLWINFTSAANEDQPSIRIGPGGAFVMEGFFVSTEIIAIIGPTTGQEFTAKEG